MEPKRLIEVTGESVQEAINKGLAELGAAPNEVIVEVLEEPSRGVFGIGARPAKVRIQLLFVRPASPPETPAPQASRQSQPSKQRQERKERRPRGQGSRQQKARRSEAPLEESYLEDQEDDDSLPLPDSGTEVPENEITEDVAVARDVLAELLKNMSIQARISVRRVETTRESENTPWMLNIMGSNLNALIGRRGETLAALQYITRLISSRILQRRANIIVDIDGYKLRRSEMLRGLAVRMAEQAVKQKRVISLEPMPPHERRIIHLTLREVPDVTTRSVGEGDARKVTIVPK
jgi:spoIIIJ-associated protein